MESSLIDDNIILISQEGAEIPIKKSVGSRSVYIKGMIDDQAENVPLPQINKWTIDKVVLYLEHLAAGNASPEIERPLRSNDIEDVVSDWMAEFIKGDDKKGIVGPTDDQVQDLILAANFLDIKCLLALACAQLATHIRGLSIPEFRKRFNLINDFTPEEEAEPFDEAKIAELAEAHEREEKAKEEAQGAKQEESKSAVEEEKKSE